MPLEIEAKLKLSRPAALRRRLRQAGAVLQGRLIELDTFFDTPKRTLLAADSGLRLRQQRAQPAGRQRCILAFKGPRRAGMLKSRLEIEMPVGDADAAAALLAALGYRAMLGFEKRREVWRLEGCAVSIDELPLLGRFVEIEGPDEPTITSVQRQLGLARARHIHQSYVAMLAEHPRSRALGNVISFAALEAANRRPRPAARPRRGPGKRGSAGT
jgi:adenylate cyclase class 2